MINKYFKRTFVIGFIVLLLAASYAPLISSSQNYIKQTENPTINDEFYVEITKPSRGLYINDEFYREFIFIRRGIVIGDLTLEATAVDDVNGIDRVIFHVVGGWNNIQHSIFLNNAYIFKLRRLHSFSHGY